MNGQAKPGPYEAVHAYPNGNASAARYARTLARYGFDGVVVRTPKAEYDPAETRARFGIDVVPGAEVQATNPASASGAVGNYRPEYPVVIVRGGTESLNRFAVEQDRVDVLARPFRADGDIDHVMVSTAKDHGVRIEFDLGPVLRGSGGPRVRHLRNLRKLRELVVDVDAPYVVSAHPTSHLSVRTPRELAAVGAEIGFDPDRLRTGLVEWGRLSMRNRERLSEEFISPGVRRGRYETDDRGTR